MLIGLADDEPDFDPVTASQISSSKRMPCRPGIDANCYQQAPDDPLGVFVRKLADRLHVEPMTVVCTAAALTVGGVGYYVAKRRF